MYSIFEKKNVVIIDVGGDDAGSTVLGRFRPQFASLDYDMLYVINRFRSKSTDLDEAIEVLQEIMAVSGLKPSGLVNNSHLMFDTNQAVFDEGLGFADTISEKTGLPILFSTIEKDLLNNGTVIPKDFTKTYPVDIHVKTVWQKQKMIQI